MSRIAPVAAVLAALGLASAGCASAPRVASTAAGAPVTTGASPGAPLPVDPPSRTPVPGPPPGAVLVTPPQNGGTVHVAVGGTVSLTGFPSNWVPVTSDGSVVADAPLPVDPSKCGRAPGIPCDLPALNYKALAKGTVKLTAHRTQCGEARPCTPPDGYDFVLTVVVG